MIHDISPYSFKIAKKLKVIIKPSNKPKYKIDIFDKDNNYITSIGAKGYKDFGAMGNINKKDFLKLYYNSTNNYKVLLINNNSSSDNNNLDEIYAVLRTPEKYIKK
jgi:hypothetical protein